MGTTIDKTGGNISFGTPSTEEEQDAYSTIEDAAKESGVQVDTSDGLSEEEIQSLANGNIDLSDEDIDNLIAIDPNLALILDPMAVVVMKPDIVKQLRPDILKLVKPELDESKLTEEQKAAIEEILSNEEEE